MSPKNSKKKRFIESFESDNRIKRGVDLLNVSSLIRFNFKYYSYGDGFGQSFENWQNEGILKDLNEKLHGFSSSSVEELKKSKRLALYERFPENSEFNEPIAFKNLNVKWARLRLNSSRRLIGVFVLDVPAVSDVFFVVFLDKDHQFYPMEKR